MRRTAAFLLALFLLLPLTLASRAGGDLTLTLSKEQAAVGETVRVTFSIRNNPGIISVQAKLKFDESKLQLLSVEDGGILGEEINHQEKLTSPYTLSWENYVSEKAFTEDGVLCTLTFRVLSGEAGEEIPVTVTVDTYGVMDLDLRDLARKLESGSVTVIEPGAPAVTDTAPEETAPGQRIILNVFSLQIKLPGWPVLAACCAGVLVLIAGAIVWVAVRKKKRSESKPSSKGPEDPV